MGLLSNKCHLLGTHMGSRVIIMKEEGRKKEGMGEGGRGRKMSLKCPFQFCYLVLFHYLGPTTTTTTTTTTKREIRICESMSGVWTRGTDWRGSLQVPGAASFLGPVGRPWGSPGPPFQEGSYLAGPGLLTPAAYHLDGGGRGECGLPESLRGSPTTQSGAHGGDRVRAAQPPSAGARCPLDQPTALGPAPLSLTLLAANGAAACHPHPAPRGRAGRRLAGKARGWS